MFRLDGKIAFVTGAASGLGAAACSDLAQAGADVVVTDKPGKDLAPTCAAVRGHGRRAVPLGFDVRNTSSAAACIDQIEKEWGPVNILVSNAGINRPTPGLEVTDGNWEDHFDTNVRGSFFAAQAVARGMIARRWGRIIFISSQSGLVGISGQPVYCATKGALIQLTRTLGVEWAKYGVTVNSVAPTFVETNLTRERLKNPEFRAFVERMIPCGKLALPQHVSAAIVFLASEEAAMVNAHTLCVDGGWTAW